MIENRHKNEILGDLIALRAGLSAVSQENDAIKDIRAKTDLALEKCRLDSDSLKLSIERTVDRVKELQDAETQTKNRYKYESSLLVFPHLLLGLLLIVLMLGFCGGAVAAAYFGIDFFFDELYSEGDPSVISWILCIVFTVLLGAACLAVFIAALILLGRAGFEKFEDFRDDLETRVGAKRNRDKNLKAFLSEAEGHKSDMDAYAKKTKELDETVSRLKAERDKKCLIHASVGIVIYNALRRTYGGIVAENDWGALDHILYAMTTGRADTLKEALLIADSERRKDEIVSAIHSSTDRICATVRDAAAMIGGALTAGLNRLTQAVNDGFAMQNALIGEQTSKLNALSSDISALSGSISNLDASVNMSSSLTAKLNEPSDQLVEDVRQLRIYADNEAVLRRNRV